MRRLAAFAIVIAAMAAVRELTHQATADITATALALGFALMGASVAGDALRGSIFPA